MSESTGKFMYSISFILNGEQKTAEVNAGTILQTFLRDNMNLTGVKCGCDDSNCGACTVLVNGHPIRSCCMLAVQANNCDILTIEGLSDGDKLHPLQQAFIDHFAVQCGYCTPGMLLTAKALLDENPQPTEEDIREALHGNICRCTGYKKIVEAILDVASGTYGDRDNKVKTACK